LGSVSGAVATLEEVQKAVIQIKSQGTFVNPDFSISYNADGFGSGFIIDSSGLAITNNHVVTGAALLKVWIGGDPGQTFNAKVVGVSECSDLAVIDIDGEGFPYLDWHTGPISVGMDVYAAGFPLGEPVYTLTEGRISKEEAGGETSWASLDSVIEHNATLNRAPAGRCDKTVR
jgi:serine protease Do